MIKLSVSALAALSCVVGLTTSTNAAALDFTGTRSNISPGGVPDGRCVGALTISFAPGAYAASGTSNLGDFTYTASHCLAPPPPGPYYDGVLAWDFGDGVLHGTYTGLLSATGPGQFEVSETIVFTGGTGRFAGYSGGATAAGTVTFGQYQGAFASYGDATFQGVLAVPEPASLALFAAGGLVVAGVAARRRRGLMC